MRALTASPGVGQNRPMSKTLLEARQLGRRHPSGDGWLLGEISFRLEAGERVALVGPSGSGKTLLLRALALLDPVESGEVFFEGDTVEGENSPTYRRQVVYFHQRPAIFQGTVEDNLRQPFLLKAHRRPGWNRARALELLETVGRGEGFFAQRSENLSGGEAQITALVRALQLEPRVLLLDEPTAALDPEAVANVEELLGSWLEEREDAAMIWVGHDRGQSRRMTERELQIRGGRLERGGE